MSKPISDIAFTPAVKAQQTAHGSREACARQIEKHDWSDQITEDLAAYIAQRDSFYMATVSEDGHPYIQHRGGPKGFLKVIDAKTLGFADYRGNRQYISTGNLDGNDRVHLFLTDYANSLRLKLWGRARVVNDDPALLARLADPAGKGKAERAFLITVEAWDANCPQHIPSLHDEATIRAATAKLIRRIQALEAENAELKAWLGKS